MSTVDNSQIPRRVMPKWTQWVVVTFLTMLLIIIFTFPEYIYPAYRAHMETASTTGTIISVRSEYKNNGSSKVVDYAYDYYPVVSYKPTDNATYTNNGYSDQAASTDPNYWKVGNKVTVMYNPSHPSFSDIK